MIRSHEQGGGQKEKTSYMQVFSHVLKHFEGMGRKLCHVLYRICVWISNSTCTVGSFSIVAYHITVSRHCGSYLTVIVISIIFLFSRRFCTQPWQSYIYIYFLPSELLSLFAKPISRCGYHFVRTDIEIFEIKSFPY